jgi:hypothetical protein
MNRASWPSHSAKIFLGFALFLPFIELSSAPALSQGLELWNKNCQRQHKKWKSTAKHRAFAVTNSMSGAGDGQACGWASGYATRTAAESAAIKSCKSARFGSCWIMTSE